MKSNYFAAFSQNIPSEKVMWVDASRDAENGAWLFCQTRGGDDRSKKCTQSLNQPEIPSFVMVLGC